MELTLDTFLTAYAVDDNEWWRLSEGDMHNLFDELLERHKELLEQNEQRRRYIERISIALDSYPDSNLVSLATTLNEREKALTTALEEIKALVSWHVDTEADPSNQSPEDMAAHINGLVWQLCQQA